MVKGQGGYCDGNGNPKPSNSTMLFEESLEVQRGLIQFKILDSEPMTVFWW